ncbi:MAG: hypothetical protein ABJQ70_13170 [Roseobacter sp.]
MAIICIMFVSFLSAITSSVVASAFGMSIVMGIVMFHSIFFGTLGMIWVLACSQRILQGWSARHMRF